MIIFIFNLPIHAKRDAILDALEEYDALVVSGETGSGKTTQVPSYLLEDAISAGCGSACRIVCTQPRRISAVSIARWVYFIMYRYISCQILLTI